MCAVLSGSLSTTPTPVGSEDARSSTADTVKLLQSASAAAAAATSDKKTEDEAGGDPVAEPGDEDDNVVTTIDEVGITHF